MTISELQFKMAMEKLAFHQQKVEEYKAITRRFLYEQESIRVETRKVDSDKYHRENAEDRN